MVDNQLWSACGLGAQLNAYQDDADDARRRDDEKDEICYNY